MKTSMIPRLGRTLLLAVCVIACSRPLLAADGAKPKTDLRIPLNLALGKPATASASQAGNQPSNATDGDAATRWCASEEKTGHWWQVELTKPEDLNRCRITWEFDATKYQYKVEGSPDGKAWSMLVDATGDKAATTQVQEHKLDAHGVRYVRVTVTGLEPAKWPSFSEFELYDGKQFADPAQLAASKSAALLREIKAPAGFVTTIFAAPPNVSYPVCLVAAPNGDVFVACDPNGSLDQKTGLGKIIRCRDTNDDGVADEFTTFAQVDSPRGIVWDAAANTMYVQHPPLVQAYHDDNGDGVSDRVETLVEGLGFDLNFRGADHTTNGMQLGIDGYLYIAVGDYGFLGAKGRDGKTLKLHGGGVVRVRTDGTQLEIVSRGQRNIYDVAVSPTLDLFTRDNTNDGDGWDVRLSHVVQTGNYGYPSLFKHFTDETLQPLGIYGGGSPTGSIYLDEPGLPKEFGRTLITCDWGRNWIYAHPLTPSGASFKAEQREFIEMPRPIDLDVDARSRLYAASWRGGGFNYSGPDVGYVARITHPAAATIPAMPDLKTLSDDALIALLDSDSGVRRQAAQREILTRRGRGDFRDIGQLVRKGRSDASRVAAMFTELQLNDEHSFSRMRAYMEFSNVREYAIRAGTDDVRHAADVPATPLISVLKDENPRVRLAAVIALARLGKVEAAGAVVPLVADADPVVAHAAVNALVTLRAVKPCLQAIDDARTPLFPGVLRALQALHEPEVATGLIERLNRATDPSLRRMILTALCRLTYRDADWTGGWWGTRPDTSGPYYSPEPWSQTQPILTALRQQLDTADRETLRHLVLEVIRHKLDLPEAMPKLIALSHDDQKLQATAAEFLASRPSLSADAVTLLTDTAKSTSQPAQLRSRVLRSLYASNQPGALEAAAGVLATLGDDAPADLARTRADFVREGSQANHVDTFARLATSNDPNTRELAYGVLLQLVTQKQTAAPASAAAKRAIDAGWGKPDQAASLLRAIGRDKVDAYSADVKARLSDTSEPVKAAAAFAADRLGSGAAAKPGEHKTLIADLSYEQARDGALKAEGDAKLGGELFIRQGCIACHTVSKNETPKGPYLGGIAQRYNRSELIESILKPNEKIAQGFTTHYFVTKKRERVDGFVVRESGDETEVRGASGVSVVLKKDNIAKTGTLPTSIMPEGLAANLSPGDLASLLAYLESLKAE